MENSNPAFIYVIEDVIRTEPAGPFKGLGECYNHYYKLANFEHPVSFFSNKPEAKEVGQTIVGRVKLDPNGYGYKFGKVEYQSDEWNNATEWKGEQPTAGSTLVSGVADSALVRLNAQLVAIQYLSNTHGGEPFSTDQVFNYADMFEAYARGGQA